MNDTVIEVANVSKRYRLGVVGTGTLSHDLNRWWAKVRGRPDPTLEIGQPTAGRKQSVVSGYGQSTSDYMWALKDLSFEVRRGEVLGIIGRNGAGKSTILKIFSRVTAPTCGEVRVSGRIASLLEVGTGFHPELTGRENILLNGAILGMRKAEIARRFDEIVAFSGVEQYIDTPVKRYSSGMYVRLAFAVAAHLEPEILLVDEVLAVGDTEFQKKCLGKMGDMGQEGRTVLIVSHNMPSIVNLCQRAILLNGGRIEADGQAAEIVQRYLTTAPSAGGEVVWPDSAQAPGNEIARLLAVRILQDGIDGPTADVSISEDVFVQISYRNLQDGTELYASIWLRDKMGTDVLASSNAKSVSLTEDPWYGRPHPPGLFQSVCRIPGNFLNEGLYNISVIVVNEATRTRIVEDYVLSFDVHDTGEMRKEHTGGQWLGVVRPRLAWSTEYFGPEDTSVEAADQ